MPMAGGLAALFTRDLTRLVQELQAFPSDESMWRHAAGVKNSAGNLRECIGWQLGSVAYSRERDREFTLNGFSRDHLVQRMEQVKELVAKVVAQLSDDDLAAAFQERVLDTTLSSHDYLVHLHGHLNFHLGQIDYLRRILTEGSTVTFAGL